MHCYRKTIYLIVIFVLVLNKFTGAINIDTVFITDDKNELYFYKQLYLKSGVNPKEIDSFNNIYLVRSIVKKYDKNIAPNFGFSNVNQLFYFGLKNNSEKSSWLLEIPYPFYNQLDVYFFADGKKIKKITVGDHFKFSERPYNSKNFVFELNLKKHEFTEVVCVIHCNGEATSFPVKILSKTKQTENYFNEQLFLGFYYGILLFALFLSLFLGFSLKERINFWYFLYIIGVFFFQFSLDGLAFQFFWPNNTWLANHIIPVAGNFAVLFLILFTRNLLQVCKQFKKTDVVLKILIAFTVLLLLFGMMPNPLFTFSLMASNFNVMLVNVIILSVSIVAWRRNYKPARYFIIAFFLLIVGVLITMSKNFGLLPRVFFTEYAVQMGSAIEVIFFSFALSERVKLLKEEKETVQEQLLIQLQENNKLQQEINIELEKKVEERTIEIKEQNKIISQINKDLTDSINYAKRIQEALLPKSKFHGITEENSFIFYQPKDIISGDFYWFQSIGNISFAVVADCTGHGVPGALMSMIGSTLLNKIISENPALMPSEILHKLDKNIIDILHQGVQENALKDGMDVAMAKIDFVSNTLQYCGAMRPGIVVRNEEIIELDASKFSVGGYIPEFEKIFIDTTLQLLSNDVIFMFSDGFPDQFGGPKNKKFMSKNLKNLFVTIAPEKSAIQGKIISDTLNGWKGKNTQTDDILVVGIKI